MTKVIEIIVTPKGETTITIKGFVGGECHEARRFREDWDSVIPNDSRQSFTKAN